MKKLSFIVCLFLANFGFSQSDDIHEDVARIIDVWLDAQRDYDKLPAISVAVVQDQDILWKNAYGESNMEDGVPAETTTICSICSISKLFTSVAIMKLVEEGKLRLDTYLTGRGGQVAWREGRLMQMGEC